MLVRSCNVKSDIYFNCYYNNTYLLIYSIVYGFHGIIIIIYILIRKCKYRQYIFQIIIFHSNDVQKLFLLLQKLQQLSSLSLIQVGHL